MAREREREQGGKKEKEVKKKKEKESSFWISGESSDQFLSCPTAAEADRTTRAFAFLTPDRRGERFNFSEQTNTTRKNDET